MGQLKNILYIVLGGNFENFGNMRCFDARLNLEKYPFCLWPYVFALPWSIFSVNMRYFSIDPRMSLKQYAS